MLFQGLGNMKLRHHRQLIENIISLNLLNGVNMVLPLVTLPYLIKVVGLEKYGCYSVVFSMLQFSIMLSSYGFNFSTTKKIAQNRSDKTLVNAIFNATLACRFLIAIGVFAIMFIICIVVYDKQYRIMYLLGVGMVIGDILNPTWLFQGMERMKYMTIINLIAKLTFTIFIFFSIRAEHDYLKITLYNSFGYLISGIASLMIASVSFKIKIDVPQKHHIISQFKEGWYLFLTTVSMGLYRNSNIFILGFFVSNVMIGAYASAEKIIKAVQAITTPVTTALFPYVAKSFKTSTEHMKLYVLRKLSISIGVVFVVITVVVYLAIPSINQILLDNHDLTKPLIVGLLPVIFFGGMNYILGIIGLTNLDHQKTLFRFVMISGALSIAILLCIVHLIGIWSAVVAMVACEIFLFVMCLSYLIKLSYTIKQTNAENL